MSKGVTESERMSELCAGDILDGFTVEEVTPIPSMRASAVRARHLKTGAQLLHVHTPDDTENCFAVTFPTPPPDDTGLPHILEHSVLGGSMKYPVRDPFFAMVKTSLATFINAMTSQVFTTYPMASNVRKDFQNLVEVCLDSVFHPRLAADTFRREGHHFTLEDNAATASALRISGIVYNEMKGYYSIQDMVLPTLVRRELYPDTLLGRDAGGDPDCIPNLTYEQFRAFHEAYYHPSNSLLFLFGDIPTREHFRLLNPVLETFDRRDIPIGLPRQSRWSEPRRREKGYAIGAEDDVTGRTYMAMNWIVGDALDPSVATDWKILSMLLLGNEAAPLKQALIDAKLGSDIFFSGSWAHAYEQEFHIGLKGSESEREPAFEQLVLKTLEVLADHPFERERVESAFQQVAYDTLEVKTLFPIHTLYAALATWPYGGDPLTFVNAREQLAASLARYEADPLLFNRLIRDGLMSNPHRLMVVLKPDREMQARSEAAFAEKMNHERALMSEEQIAQIAQTALALAAAQDKPDAPEDLAKLPHLAISDLPPRPRRIPTEAGQIAGMTVLRHDVFSNGINYLHIDMDLSGLPGDLYAWLPRYHGVIAKMGVAGEDFTGVAARRAAHTGGLWSHSFVGQHATNPGNTLRRIIFGLRTLDDQAGPALDLLGRLIFTADPFDPARLRDVLAQTRSGYQTALVDDGMYIAHNQAARGIHPAAALDHLFFSPDGFRDLKTLEENFDERAQEAMDQVARIRDFLVRHARWTISFTGSDKVFGELTRSLENWEAQRSGWKVVPDIPSPFQPFSTPPREGLAGPMKIAHCIKAMPAPHLGHPDTPLLKLGVYLAQFDYMIPQIRFKGNAYGAGIEHDDLRGKLTLSSFFDPNVFETLSVFDALRAYIDDQHWSQTDVDRAIIGSVKEAEHPIRPGEATGRGLVQYVRGDHDDERERRYAATLRATPAAIKQTMLNFLDAQESRAAVCVVSSREKLLAANERLGERRLDISNLLD